MIKLYELLTEAIAEATMVENNIDLGDKTQEFQEKLELMSSKNQTLLIDFVEKLNDSEKKELGSLINRYSSVNNLKAPKTSFEIKLSLLFVNPVGPGEILFHLELQDSNMDIGDQTNHDLIVKGKIWEVKKVIGITPNAIPTSKPNQPKTNFRLAKKGKASQFKFNTDLLKTVIIIDDINATSRMEEDFNDISPKLRKALDDFDSLILSSTPREAILRGDHNGRFKKQMIKIINDIKSEIEVNTDDEFTNVKFGGVNVVPKEKGIDPVSINTVNDDSITLNFIGRDTLKAIEKLNDLPYVQDADFINDMDAAVMEALEDMPSMIIWGQDGKILIIEKEKFKEIFEFGGVTQGNLQVKVKDDVWKNA